MSIAGIRSNRGDVYQTLIAFGWALTVLSDPEYLWLEIDSTAHPIDDVVIGKSDGSLICCQCKKNQTDFRAWSTTDLADELGKAFLELVRSQQASVFFYSRSDFGVLAKLREFSTAFLTQADYRKNLTKAHTQTDSDLTALIAEQNLRLSTFEFLHRTTFEVTPDFPRLKTLLRERLRQMASNSNAAFDALWRRLDELGGRVGSSNLSAPTQHRLTKEDLEDTLHHAGAMLVPVMSIANVRQSFSTTSNIGRSWVRDIAGQKIPSSVVEDLLAAIDAKKRSVLLTGPPGSGKTCVMLSLQEALEQRAQTQTDLVPLFIQSREFADLATAQERQAQGLSEKWVEQAARLAEDAHVVVAIDSLDVLSIAREHSVLTYFLAQIDQLLSIPNVTVVTACRDFDRKYDRRIAVRQWDCELQCIPLDWESEVAPLLDDLGVDLDGIDTVTRELIRNPRELALFVELALHEGSFSVVASQALAQRYLESIVQADPALGDRAMQAIEAIAGEMLSSRSLSIPQQRFKASQDALRRLRSLNVLLDTQDGNLTFGHQTLLDVLVISGALRQGISLNEFIQGLPPVPFIRPSIRSFVAQLASGERREFRKQLRAVLAGDAAFHIRRLVADSFAQQIPHDDDWPLIRNLRDNHRDVYQVIYTHASLVEWHHFWLRHLVPTLRELRDAAELTAHVHRIAFWVNSDPEGVVEFWLEALSLDWLDTNRIAEQIAFSLSEFKEEHLLLVAPLLNRLLNIPKPEHSFLGRTVARCVTADAIGDDLLWRFIAADVTEGDVTKYHLGKKLHCQPHDFGDKNENFLKERMANSTTLLDLALEVIEQWSRIRSVHYGETRIGYRHGFLTETSYNDIHSQHDIHHVDDERALLDAVEVAILDHIQQDSVWWRRNRERLCFNHEGALCYFAIEGITKSPMSNLDVIGRLLSSRDLLEFELSFELGTLIQAAFVYLDGETQDAVMGTIQTIWEEKVTDEGTRYWILKKRAEYASAIPCQLRSPNVQAILDTYESTYGTFIRQPSIHSRGGTVSAPFSYEVFLRTSDDDVIRLLAHYSGYSRDFDDLLVGGEREVGWQLREASSRNPTRFLRLLTTHWATIAAGFCDDIMDGISNYLAHRYGKLGVKDSWEPIEEPYAQLLANQILDELERHPSHWRLTRSTAKALEACANVIQDTQDASRLVFLSIPFGCLYEESSIHGDAVNLVTTGINMKTGDVAEALMIVANNFQERETAFPELLAPTLRRFASNEHPAIRALILRRLPYFQSKDFELGWELFELAMQDSVGLWQSAEQFLYYAYHDHFEKVASSLNRIAREGSKEDLETWGRILALCAMTGHIDFADFLGELNSLDVTEAWQGAASVWTHSGNIRQHREQCVTGIKAGLNAGGLNAITVARSVDNIFRENAPPVAIPAELIQLCFAVFESDSEDKHNRLFGFHEWLNTTSQRDPESALSAVEIYLAYVSRAKPYLYDHDNQLVQLMTRLFSEAEEREESDHGEMLKRVVSVQDSMLSLGVSSISDWLAAAERQ